MNIFNVMSKGIYLCFIVNNVQAQTTNSLKLNIAYSKNPMGYTQVYCKKTDFPIVDFDSANFIILDKGVFYLATEKKKSGIIKHFSLDNKLQSERAGIYTVILYSKLSGDTIVKFSGYKNQPIDKWLFITKKNITTNIMDFITGRIDYFNIDDIKFETEKGQIITIPVFFAPIIDRNEKEILKSISVFKSYYTHGEIIIDENKYYVYIKDIALQNYFDNFNTGIKIVSDSNAIYNNQSQFYKIGDTINIDNKNRIIFTKINHRGDTAIYKILSNSLITKEGFNEGYRGVGFTFLDINTNKLADIDSLLKKKDFILMDFWGTWCGPCIAGIPKLRSIAIKFKKQLNVVSIACENKYNISKVKEANKKYNMTWFNWAVNRKGDLSHGSLIYQYRVTEFPTYFLLDKSRKILYRGSSESELYKIEAFLHKYTKKGK